MNAPRAESLNLFPVHSGPNLATWLGLATLPRPNVVGLDRDIKLEATNGIGARDQLTILRPTACCFYHCCQLQFPYQTTTKTPRLGMLLCPAPKIAPMSRERGEAGKPIAWVGLQPFYRASALKSTATELVRATSRLRLFVHRVIGPRLSFPVFFLPCLALAYSIPRAPLASLLMHVLHHRREPAG